MLEVDVYPGGRREAARPPAIRNHRHSSPQGKSGLLDLPELETRIASAQPVTEMLRSELKNTQQELELQKQAMAVEAARMAARLSCLEGELAAVAGHSAAIRGTISKERNLWSALAAASVMIALSVFCAPGWRVTRQTTEIPSSRPAAKTVPSVARSEVRQDNNLPPEPHAALTMALDRLNDALAAAPGDNPEETLREVSTTGKGCMLVWNDSFPSLLFGRDPVRKNSLAHTLADCAEAVSRRQPGATAPQH